MARYFGLDHLRTMLQGIKDAGGLKGALYKLYR